MLAKICKIIIIFKAVLGIKRNGPDFGRGVSCQTNLSLVTKGIQQSVP